MRCIACGENMILFSSVPDIAMIVPGYERQTLQCSGCGESEHRLIFNPVRSPRTREIWERTNLRFRERQAIPRCLACGKEMTLVETVLDNNMMIPGYERQTYRCAAVAFLNPGLFSSLRLTGRSPLRSVLKRVGLSRLRVLYCVCT